MFQKNVRLIKRPPKHSLANKGLGSCLGVDCLFFNLGNPQKYLVRNLLISEQEEMRG